MWDTLQKLLVTHTDHCLTVENDVTEKCILLSYSSITTFMSILRNLISQYLKALQNLKQGLSLTEKNIPSVNAFNITLLSCAT